MIKVVSVHSEKINSIDYILNELTNLKNKYFKLLSLANNVGNNEKNEAFYNNEMNEKLKEENNNHKSQPDLKFTNIEIKSYFNKIYINDMNITNQFPLNLKKGDNFDVIINCCFIFCFIFIIFII